MLHVSTTSRSPEVRRGDRLPRGTQLCTTALPEWRHRCRFPSPFTKYKGVSRYDAIPRGRSELVIDFTHKSASSANPERPYGSADSGSLTDPSTVLYDPGADHSGRSDAHQCQWQGRPA